jgi:urea carboxylase-associated protein 2
MSDTATTSAARSHARAQAAAAAATVVCKPTIPSCDAVDLPADVARDTLRWDETVPGGGYATRVLERGARLRLVDLAGDACVGLLLYNADAPAERLNVADTVKVQWQAYLGPGALLLSDMGRVLATMVRDTCARHDTFCGTSTERSNRARYGDGANHGACPSGRARFVLGLAKHGLTRRDVCANVNLFKGVRVARDGVLTFVETPGGAGALIELRAEMRVLVALVNVPHVLDPRPRYTATPVRVLASAGPVTAVDDAFRTSTPERLRAFQNVEDYYAC